MLRPRLLCIASLLACTPSEPVAVAVTQKDDPAADRRSRCEGFARDAAQIARFGGAAVVVGLGGEGTRELGEGLAAASGQIGGEVFAKCMTWPEPVLDCLGPLGGLRAGCDELVSEALGLGPVRLPADIPAGPRPAWTLSLPAKPSALAVAIDGTVLAIVDRQLLAVRDGAIVWRLEPPVRGWWLRQIPGTTMVLVTRDDRVLAVDVATGKEAWSIALPPRSTDPEEVKWLEPPAAAVIAWDPKAASWLVGDTVARFFYLRPERCKGAGKKAPKDCLTPAGELVDEQLDEDARLLIDAGGRRFLHEDDTVRGFDDAWQTTMTANAHESLDQVALTSAGLLLLIDDDVVVLDPGACSGTFAPSGWPQPGKLYFRDGDLCADCGRSPSGCRRARAYVEDLQTETPALLDGGAVVVHAAGFTRALADGKPLWHTTTGGGGPLLRIGDRVIGVSTGVEEHDPLALFALTAADGKHVWRAPLAISMPDSYYSTDDILLAHGGSLLIAGYREQLVAVALTE